MKIAITSTGPSLDDNVEARFGRCPYFLIINPETSELDAMANPNIALGGGAGPQSAQLMAEKGVSTVLTGNCGPNAFQAFGAVGIQVITGVSGPVRQALSQFQSGRLVQSTAPNVESHFGMGAGKGMGGRGCGGRGMGMRGGGGGGGGMRRTGGMNLSADDPQPRALTPQSTQQSPQAEDEVAELKQTADDLKVKLEEVERRLAALSKKK